MRLVYKYIPAARVTYFTDELLRFTQPGAQNDPFECLPTIEDKALRSLMHRVFEEKPPTAYLDLFKKLPRRQRRAKSREFIKSQLKEDRKRLASTGQWRTKFLATVQEVSKNIGIFSVSRRWDSSLMWGHYAESHKGLCIGFDADHDFFSDKVDTATFMGLRPVTYAKKRHTVSELDVSPAHLIENLTTKSTDWEYEQEERIVSVLARAEKSYGDDDEFPIFLFKVPHDSVKEVILGVNSSLKTVDAAKCFGGKIGADVFSARLSSSSFDLERHIVLERAPK